MNRKLARHFPLTRKWVRQLDALEEKYARLKKQREELKADLAQAKTWLEALTRERDERRAALLKQQSDLPIPPESLRLRVHGKTDEATFLSYGHEIAESIKQLLNAEERPFDSFKNILDFGCGCGRVIRFFEHQADNSQLFATDIDPEAIEWCKNNLSGIAKFGVNRDQPPFDYKDDAFDLVYSISVFTHLPDELELAWLAELRRVVRPGGLLILTVHGERLFRQVPKASRAELDQRGFCYVNIGGTAGLPDYYQVSYHSQEYIRRRWSDFFRIRTITSFGDQDAVLCEKLPKEH